MYKSKFGKAASITPDQFVSCPFTQEKRRIENLYMYVGCYTVCDFQLWKILYYKLYVVAHKQQLPFRFKQWLQWDGIIPSYMVMRRYNWNIETFPRNLLINRNEIKYSFYKNFINMIEIRSTILRYWDFKENCKYSVFWEVFFFFGMSSNAMSYINITVCHYINFITRHIAMCFNMAHN